MNEKYTIDQLTEFGMSLKKQQYNEKEEEVGDIWRRGYVNSPSGREKAMSEIPEPQLSAVMKVWGDSPTLTDDDPIIGDN